MTSLEELREAIEAFHIEGQGPISCVPLWAARRVKQTLLQLLETHTPEKIEALLKGEAWIAPNEPTDEMGKASALKYNCACGVRVTQWGVNAWQAMRQSSEEEK